MPDINLLLALSWRNHLMHDAAQEWFGARDGAPWASCPVTQAGLLRLSLQPAVVGRSVAWHEATSLLHRLLGLRGARQWALPADLLSASFVGSAPVSGHRQVSDLVLVAVARHHEGRLATFDRSLPHALLPRDRSLVDVLDPAPDS